MNNNRLGVGGGGTLVASVQINNNSTYYVGENQNSAYTFDTPLITARPANPASWNWAP